MKLKFLTKNQIDKVKWDDCIKQTPNHLIYAYSWYLDSVVENWGGLVSSDYSCIMPIIWRSKFGLKYIYRPFLVQQLGVFCKNKSRVKIDYFVTQIPKKFKHINYNFNFDNKVENFNTTENTNYILNLNFEYEILKKNYSKNTKTYISKANKNNLTLQKLDFDEFLKFKIQNLPNKLNKSDFDKMKKLHSILKEKSYILGVYSGEKLVSGAFFAFDENTFYYLAAATSELGRKTSASFFLMNNFIKQHCNKPYKLDFEGSNIPGVARFFAGWGAEKTTYHTLNINKLPFFLKILKK